MKTNTLEKLFAEIDQENQAHHKNRSAIEEKIQAELNKTYDDWTALQKAIGDSEDSIEYMWDKYGEVSTWVRFHELSDVPEREREYLSNYLSEYHYIRVDWDNDCFERSQGPCIIIGSDGNIYDQETAKWIIDKKDYLDDDWKIDETLRNQLIETHMEKTGCFPAVLRDDGHGNLFYVNTLPEKETKK